MLKGTVLFIDNDLDFLSTMSQVLQRQRYDVIQATGTAEAEQVLKSRTVDLAIVDIRLISDTDEKDRSGLEFAEDLRFRDVPKIVHTGYPRADLVKESLSAVGEKVPVALDFVAKEEGPQALILAVSKAMAILHVQNQTRSRCLSGSTRDVFMVYGHDMSAKSEVENLLMRIGLRTVDLSEQAGNGRTIIEQLESHSNVRCALVLLTPDDVGYAQNNPASQEARPRQNVVFELGFFIGRLGRDRVWSIRKGTCGILSDYHGVVYIQMDEHGAWKMRLTKQLKDAGFEVDSFFADNSRDFLDTEAALLERAGFVVVKAYSLGEAERLLNEDWFHLALLDVRLEDDSDEKDFRGLNLAKSEKHASVPKIMLTSFPSYLLQALVGLSPVVDFLGKEEGAQKLVEAVEGAMHKRVHTNLDLSILFSADSSLSWWQISRWVDPGQGEEMASSRAEEMEDVFRQMFCEKSRIAIERVLWRAANRIAVAVYATSDRSAPEWFLIVCGSRASVRDQATLYRMFAPRAAGKNSTVLVKTSETTHFAANLYTLAGTELDRIHTISELYQIGSEKTFSGALQYLFEEILQNWTEAKCVQHHAKAVGGSSGVTWLVARSAFVERLGQLAPSFALLKLQIIVRPETVDVQYRGESFQYSNPALILYDTMQASMGKCRFLRILPA